MICDHSPLIYGSEFGCTIVMHSVDNYPRLNNCLVCFEIRAESVCICFLGTFPVGRVLPF